jgi:putative flippase GtrA
MNHQLNIKRFSNPLNYKIIKFISTGILNTLVGYTIYAALISINLPYLTALFIATTAGVVFNYFSFGRIVFHNTGNYLVFVKFIISYGVVYAINAALLDVLMKYFLFSPYTGQIACVPPNVILSWLLMNYWVYKKDTIDDKE